jgi:sugar (pentulose or hexulose) kinase
LIPPYPAAIPNAYSTEVQIFRGYWMVNWFKEQFGHLEQARALAEDIAPEQLFDDLVNTVPAGSMGLMLQPYWTPGIRVPGPEAKGAIIGFGDVHTRAHVYRVCAQGWQGAHRTAQRGRDHGAARVRGRLAKRCGDAADGRYFWLAHGTPAYL